MRRVILLLLVLCSSSAAFSQVAGTIAPVPPVIMPYYGPSISVVDHNGNLLVFDVTYSYTAPAANTTILRLVPASKTRLTVIRSNGQPDKPVEFEGAFQVLGAGWYAVYAVSNTYTLSSGGGGTSGGSVVGAIGGGSGVLNNAGTMISFTTRRKLIAISTDPTVHVPDPLNVPLRSEVKLTSSPDGLAPDTISFVDPQLNPLILAPTGQTAAPLNLRYAQIITWDGKSPAFAKTDPVPLP